MLSVLGKSLLLLLNNLLPPCWQELDVQCRNPLPTYFDFYIHLILEKIITNWLERFSPHKRFGNAVFTAAQCTCYLHILIFTNTWFKLILVPKIFSLHILKLCVQFSVVCLIHIWLLHPLCFNSFGLKDFLHIKNKILKLCVSLHILTSTSTWFLICRCCPLQWRFGTPSVLRIFTLMANVSGQVAALELESSYNSFYRPYCVKRVLTWDMLDISRPAGIKFRFSCAYSGLLKMFLSSCCWLICGDFLALMWGFWFSWLIWRCFSLQAGGKKCILCSVRQNTSMLPQGKYILIQCEGKYTIYKFTMQDTMQYHTVQCKVYYNYCNRHFSCGKKIHCKGLHCIWSTFILLYNRTHVLHVCNIQRNIL